MPNTDTPADRRIMPRLGEAHRVPLVNLREGDAAVLAGFPIAGLLVGSVVWSPLVAPLTLLGVLVGVVAVSAAPSHRPAWTWLQDVTRYYLGRPRYTLAAPPDESGTEEGTVAYTPFTPDERTQDLTSVVRAWPGAGVVERDDGTLEAFLEVQPANMDFAMSGDWAERQAAGERFANDELDFELTMYTTTQSFPADSLVERLADRQADTDVATNDMFERLLAEYRERRPAELADTRQHRYYLGVTVHPSDLRSRDTAPTPGDRLAALPVIGWLVAPFVIDTEETGAERQALYETATDRCRTIESELVADLDDWSATRLSTLELFVVAAEYWNGVEYDDPNRLLNTEPSVSTPQRRAQSSSGSEGAVE